MNIPEPLRTQLQRSFGWFTASETTVGIVLAIVVGVAAGLGAVVFRWLIRGYQLLFFDKGADYLQFMGDYYVIILPVIGGLIVGPMIYVLAREARGEGPPEVMKAVAVGAGHIRARVAAVKIVASSICIGSGGSVGREGPIVQIGSSVGSAIGQRLKLTDEWVKTLVLCGAAGGIAATFNAPVGGVFFALEVLSRRLLTAKLFNIMISAIAAEYVAWIFLGPNPSFVVEEYTLSNYWEILAYVVLGILAGILAIAFIRLFFKVEDIFGSVKMPPYLKPALGGLGVGVIGFYYAGIFGVGYGSGYGPGGVSFATGPVDAMLAGQLGLTLLIALLFLKMIATSITLGSGGSGGVFAPSLFLGAAFGGLFGVVAADLFPDVVSTHIGAYSLVGMGAFFAATVQGPITAMVLLLEMTRNIEMLLPIMTAIVAASITARAISIDSIYTIRLKREGVRIPDEEAVPIMRTITVAEAMTRNFPSVSPEMPVNELLTKLTRTGHHGFPVVDEKGRLFGVVTLTDVEAVMAGGTDELTVKDIAIKSPVVAYPDQSLREALFGLGAKDVGRIPVVDRNDRTKLLGVLRRHDIIKAYQNKLLEVTKHESGY